MAGVEFPYLTQEDVIAGGGLDMAGIWWETRLDPCDECGCDS
jgi:hypothetical protein